jgi:hypothetical protein
VAACHQFNAEQQATPANIADNRVALLEVAKLGFQVIPNLAGTLRQPVPKDNLDHLAPDCGRQRIGGVREKCSRVNTMSGD